MPSPHSLRRLADLTKRVHDDLRRGGMGMTFRYLFRSTAILARVVALLADQVATAAEEEERRGKDGAPAAEPRSGRSTAGRARRTSAGR